MQDRAGRYFYKRSASNPRYLRCWSAPVWIVAKLASLMPTFFCIWTLRVGTDRWAVRCTAREIARATHTDHPSITRKRSGIATPVSHQITLRICRGGEGLGQRAIDAVADAEAVAAPGTEIVIALPAKLLSGLQVERR